MVKSRGAGAETALGREGKTIGLPLIRNRSFFIVFPSVSPSPNFLGCITSIFFNFVSIKNLKSASSFLEFFISIFF
jgi:hypothetical protein